ncbi:glycosyltransferase family 2 protein [Parahaliea aestuarii]|uniref:Glycosyltransferase n=1 Tax=Parahaliea aestuarii TaxID=1852021 RepID=A0A5C9A0Y4_9GAMM|nr:glycosyltransferase [Parahaliea aestuarii]TXS94535.1 glycosyltransferase [Parahaliea aestuarii]
MDQQIGRLEPSGRPQVSVCIAHYRGIDLLADCIDSVLNQTGNVRAEIIVHDDASDPESLQFLATRYPQVKVIASDSNVGFCIANNRMVEEAKGQFLLILNNDAALLPDALDTLMQGQRDHGDNVFTLPQFDWASGELVDRGCSIDPFYNPIPNRDERISEVAMTIGACLWISGSHWRDMGGFPEWMGSIGEDLYLCCRTRLAGLKVIALGGSGYRHRQGHSFGGNRPDHNGRLASTIERRFMSERNKLSVLLTCTPTILVWPSLLISILTLLMEGLLLSTLKRRPEVFADIYFAAIRALGQKFRFLLAHRQQVQSTRRTSALEYFSAFSWKPRKLAMLLKYGIPSVSSGPDRRENKL